MTDIKKEFHSLSFHYIPPINVDEGTYFIVCEKWIVHATTLSLDDVLYVLTYLVSLLSISKLIIQNNCCAIFYPPIVFHDLQTGTKIRLGREREGLY